MSAASTMAKSEISNAVRPPRVSRASGGPAMAMNAALLPTSSPARARSAGSV